MNSKSTTSAKSGKNWRQATRMVHQGVLRSQFGETSEALFLTQGYVYETAEAAHRRFTGDDPGYIYSRYANPTVSMFEDRIASLDGAEGARATASGMAAVTAALFASVQSGDHIVAAKALFGSILYVINDLLPTLGVTCTLVDGTNIAQWREAVQPNTKVFFLETPTNPTLEIIDIAAVAEISKSCGARLMVDNVFATGILQSPLELGADVVIYSATKHIDGQGRCLGGVILSDEEWLEGRLKDWLRHTGPSISPFNAWVLLKGLETMQLRVDQQTRTAADLADRLAEHPAIERVFYPGRKDHPQYEIAQKQMKAGSTLIAFKVRGGREGAFRLENALDIILISNNLGDAKTLITHPTTTTHQRLTDKQREDAGITEGLLRLSVGLEHVDDLWEDLSTALDTLS